MGSPSSTNMRRGGSRLQYSGLPTDKNNKKKESHRKKRWGGLNPRKFHTPIRRSVESIPRVHIFFLENFMGHKIKEREEDWMTLLCISSFFCFEVSLYILLGNISLLTTLLPTFSIFFMTSKFL